MVLGHRVGSRAEEECKLERGMRGPELAVSVSALQPSANIIPSEEQRKNLPAGNELQEGSLR